MKFMYDIMALALIVLAVVIVFWLWCFPQGTPDQNRPDRFQILLEDGFTDDSLQVVLNDSVLFDGRIPFEPYALEAEMPVHEGVLMIGDYARDETAVFEIQSGGKPFRLRKDDNGNILVRK